MNGSILVVDDEETMRITLQARLRDAGHRVETAADGYEALMRLERDFYDAVLLDINMPGMSGLQVLDFIEDRSIDVDTIVLTGFADMALAVDCLRRGAKDFVVKPFDYEDLLTKIATMIRSRRSEQSLKESTRVWQSTMVYDVLGSLSSIRTILDQLQARMSAYGNEEAELFDDGRFLSDAIFGRIMESIDIHAISEARVSLNREPVRLQGLLNNICDRLARRSRDKAFVIERHIDEAIPLILCDHSRLEQALNILFDSAASLGVPGGAFLVDTHMVDRVGNDHAAVSFRIAYPGPVPVPAELPFILAGIAERAKKPVPIITFQGMSLTIARRLIEEHGGTFGIESGSNGSTVFTFTLPTALPDQSESMQQR